MWTFRRGSTSIGGSLVVEPVITFLAGPPMPLLDIVCNVQYTKTHKQDTRALCTS